MGRSVLSPTRLSVESMSPIPFFVILLVIGSINAKPNPMGESEEEPEPEPEPEAGKKCTDCESRFKYTKAGDDDGPVIYELRSCKLHLMMKDADKKFNYILIVSTSIWYTYI